MKIKWTTITEDESTWPPEQKDFIANNSKKSFQSCWWERCRDDRIMEIFGNRFCKFPYEAIGIQWRPMPKPPKKKVKKSPWKSTSIKPKLGSYFIVRGNGKIRGIYCYEMIGYNNIPGITEIDFNSWQEWMEIPE